MGRVRADIPPLDGSQLALSIVRIEPGGRLPCGDAQRDSLLFVSSGEGSLEHSGRHAVAAGTASLVLAGELAELSAQGSELTVVCATVGPDADRHAPLGPRERVVRLQGSGDGQAAEARSFQVLFGPHNGSTRATLFAGFVPPGRAPWHYHLYDEIVWLPEGPGNLHLDGRVEELGGGSAFRLRPREAHIVENAGDREMTVLGVFTPAGSPAAAYLTTRIAAERAVSA